MKRRQGFTLVELLVSMALIIFIMAILSGAFQAALTSFRNLKGEGDMAEKLRAVTQLLQRDLSADHFEGKKRLSDPSFWLNGPPQQGFFQLVHGSASTTVGPNNFIEGYDNDLVFPAYLFGIGSYRSTDHALSFTVKLRGNQMGDFFSASGGMSALSGLFGPPEARYQTATSGGSYNYQWAAIGWFMQSQINPTTGVQDQTITDPETGAAPVPLYTLHRRQALLVPDNSLVQPAQVTANIGNFTEMSTWANGANLYFNSPIDITVPTRRQWGGQGPYQAIPATSPLYGSDIQLNDVVSFDVRLLVQGIAPTGGTDDPFVTLLTLANPTQPVSPPANSPLFLAYGNPNVPGQAYNPSYNMLTGPMIFDTWTSVNDSLSNYSQWNVASTAQAPNTAAIPMWNSASASGPIILAIQISIRIWDFKTNQTRQVTIVQAM